MQATFKHGRTRGVDVTRKGPVERHTKPGKYKPNPYLNTPPTKLKRMIEKSDGKNKKLMKDALWSWRVTVPGPFRKTSAALDILNMAREILEA